MEKIETGTPDIAAENVERLLELFPEAATEVEGPDGEPERAVDYDVLRGLLGGDPAEGQRERYQFTWPGKADARAEALRPISKTLRPVKERSKDWDATQNLYIEGDNLDALKILRETYAGKVKLIYIDPPYNTGHDFVYRDSWARGRDEYAEDSGEVDEEGGRLVTNPESSGRFHSDWCSMMYPRLMLARDLLTDDGIILISIANQEIGNLKAISDEIYGASNCLGIIVWESKTKCQNTSTAKYQLQPKQEYILVYRKGFGRYEFNLNTASKRTYDFSDDKGPYRIRKIEEMSATGGRGRKSMIYPIMGVMPRSGKQWKYGVETIKELEARGDLLLDQGVPSFKCRPEDEDEHLDPFWSLLQTKDVGTAESAKSDLKKLMGETGFETVKPTKLLKSLVGHVLTSDEDSIVLDFFSGSATTADAVMQLNAEDGGHRRFIMVQIPEECAEGSEAAKAGYRTICDVGEERIRRAGEKVRKEVEEGNAQLELGQEPREVPDIGFRVLKVDSTNFRDVSAAPGETSQASLFEAADNVKEGRDGLDLLFEALPAFRVPYSYSIREEMIGGRLCYVVGAPGAGPGAPGADYLIACFDEDVGTGTIEAIAKRRPVYAVMRDLSLSSDDAQSNFEELFRTWSPDTVRRVI